MLSRKRTVKTIDPDSSDDDEPLSKLSNGQPKNRKPTPKDDDSSSESDIENYLQKADQIDLNSSFFDLRKEPTFDNIENNILCGVNHLNDSSSDSEKESADISQDAPSTSKLNFNQLHEYTRKIEEAKRYVEEYNKRKQAKDKETNIGSLLAAGESKNLDKKEILEGIYNSSDFESCSDSEKEGWEEVKEENKEEKTALPGGNLEIVVNMPTTVRKKKEVDLLAAIKRRINRVRKENQVLVHKVHLLCWIAHGNYVNSKIYSENVLGVALSLLPSEKCYPPNRIDLDYLEQILKWFGKTVINVEKEVPNDLTLNELLEKQIGKKEAYNKTMLVYIFIAIMRSLGVHCRLVLSFQVEPLRPPNSDLLSLSNTAGPSETKENKEKRDRKKSVAGESKVEEKSSNKIKSTRTKSTTESENVKTLHTKSSARTKSTSDIPSSKVSENTKRSVKGEVPQNTKKPIKNKVTETKTKSRAKSTRDHLKNDNLKEESSSRSKSSSELKNDTLKVRTSTRSKSSSEAKGPKTKQPDLVQNSPANISSKLDKNLIRTKSRTKSVKSPSESQSSSNKRKLRSQKQIPQVDGGNDSDSSNKPNLKKLKKEPPPCPMRIHPKRLKSVTKYRDSDSEDDFVTRSPFTKKKNESPKTVNLKKLKSRVPKSVDVRDDVVNLVKKSIKQQRDITKSKKVQRGKDEENDSDYAPEAPAKKRRESADDFSPKIKVKQRLKTRKLAEEEEKIKKKKGIDVWAEVFLESEEKWISVDIDKGRVHCVNEIYTRASHPVSYIVAWDNDNSLKDVTRRYCTNFNTVTRKLQIDQSWWEKSLKPFTGRKTARDKEEDEELDRQQIEKPLPTSITEYKNHPLYVLTRHLLKFEALYPPDPPILGFVRKEPVYSRQCVYTLHSRDIWLKHAKVVKPGEQPYKIVKARPRWDKSSNSIVSGEMLEIFGPWQTQDYEPPTAENGIVPRNAFGNVELFKPCMLPKKTVHLQLPGLNKICRRMNIDCAAALVGFDFHGGWNHPTYDGFVVCEEHADILVAAWEMEQEEIEKRELEKIEKRVYGNWRKLIRGLLIRERLKVKYDLGEMSGGGGGRKKKGLPTLATRKRKVESESD